MEFARAEKFTARVSDCYYLNDNNSFLLVKLELVKPDRIKFVAGQYVSIKVNEAGERRSYSIATTPDVDHGLSLIAEIIPQGKGSEFLTKLQPGDNVELLGPLGRFVVDPGQVEPKLLFVATGSGIAPLNSMINDLLFNQRESRPMRLNWGMRDENHLFWFDNYERLTEEHTNFVFDPVLSRASSNWILCSGYVQDCITKDFVNENIRDWGVYVCGNPRMVEEMSELFKKMGLPEEQFHHEKFG